jgi:hypothetical protein
MVFKGMSDHKVQLDLLEMMVVADFKELWDTRESFYEVCRDIRMFVVHKVSWDGRGLWATKEIRDDRVLKEPSDIKGLVDLRDYRRMPQQHSASKVLARKDIRVIEAHRVQEFREIMVSKDGRVLS